MSSLWTPDGEHRVARGPEGPPAAPAPSPASPAGGPSSHRPTAGQDDEAIDRAELEELERQLAEAPAQDVVANHCYGLFQLAALHLAQRPPRLDDARLAIDAFASVVEGLGDRLGPSIETLRDGLAQIRLAFVQISTGEQAPAGGAGAEPA
ncbi:MAG TPA: hypothetical protein VMV02_07720 [Acidimicrobiales bacterium]|nr:hypothetical protein [Acidimicrobiales bacterium]